MNSGAGSDSSSGFLRSRGTAEYRLKRMVWMKEEGECGRTREREGAKWSRIKRGLRGKMAAGCGPLISAYCRQ